MDEGNASAEKNFDHAILLSTESSSNSVTDYVKAVSKIIGSSQIHSVYNFGKHIKVYVKDKKCISEVINAGVMIKSCHTKAEFAVHPFSKVILSDVDPVIPDACIESILKSYGKLESSLIHQKFAVEEYCNVENGVRFAYMKLFEGKTVPNELSLKYQDICYKVHVKVESNSELNKHKVSSSNEMCTDKHKVSPGNEMCTNKHKVSSVSEMCTVKNYVSRKKRFKRKINETTAHKQKASSENNAVLPSECSQQNNMCYNNIFFPKQSIMNLEDNIRVVSTQSSHHAIHNNCELMNHESILTQIEAIENELALTLDIPKLTPEVLPVTFNGDYGKLTSIYDASTLYYIAR
ncbi:hypothetical protein X975_27076, partial [Stegodyphus mimosarum]